MTSDALPRLVRRSRGWNWGYALASPKRGRASPGRVAARPRPGGSRVERRIATTGRVQIDGQTVPVISASTHARVRPPMLSGHPLEADQIVLGAATLAQLHKRIGGTVIASYGRPHDVPVYVRRRAW